MKQTDIWAAILFFPLFLIAVSISANDQVKSPDQYIIKTWNSENGLPQNTVTSLLLAGDGYMWLGTQDGLARFNGIDFKIFNHDNTPALKSNMISAIHQSRDGTIWIGTEGRGVVLYQNGNFRHLDSVNNIPGDLTVTGIAEDEQGDIWIAATGKGLYKKSRSGFEVCPLPRKNRIDDFQSIHAGRNGRFWIGSRSGLYRLQAGVFTRFSKQDGLSSDSISAVLEDRKGRLWVGTEGGGLNILNNGRFEYISRKEGLADDDIMAIFEDRIGDIWVGTRAGVCRIHGNQITCLNIQSGLSDNEILVIREDREGCLWLGTSFGLNRLYKGQVVMLGARHGLPSDFIRSIFQDRRGDFWIGTHGKGLARISGDRIQTFSTRNGLRSGVVRCTLEDRQGKLWIGTSNGLSCMVQNKIETFGTRDGLSNDFIRSLYEDRNGRLWIGTVSGLNYRENDMFFPYPIDGAPSPLVVYSIFEDDAGSIWIGSRFHIIKISGDKHLILNRAKGFIGDRVWSIQQDNKKRTWVGTNTGLCLYLDEKFRFFTMKDGLPSSCIYNIVFDQAGNLWISSNNGIIFLPIQNVLDYINGKTPGLSPETLGLEEGMKTSECNGGSQPAVCMSHEGKIYVPTVKGIAIVNPGKKKKNDIAPPVKIEEIRADEKILSIKEKATLPAGTNRIEFHYAALSYLAPEKAGYKYRLDGLDRDWNHVGNRRDAYYTNLAPGEYSFHVIACNNDGVWNESGAQFSFYMQPFFYQTKLFYILCAFFMIITGLGIYRFRVRQLLAREKHLTLLVTERTRDLNEAMKELEQLSLTDALTQLPNRRHFEIIMHQEWKRCERESQPLSLLMIDIDYFKIFNDTYGHPMGDECLKKVAAAIRQSTPRASDFSARLGGEEFIIILPNTPAAGATLMAERVRAGVEKLGLMHSGSKVNKVVTISVGVATGIPDKNASSENLLGSADQGLYQAKQNGRNRFATA